MGDFGRHDRVEGSDRRPCAETDPITVGVNVAYTSTRTFRKCDAMLANLTPILATTTGASGPQIDHAGDEGVAKASIGSARRAFGHAFARQPARAAQRAERSTACDSEAVAHGTLHRIHHQALPRPGSDGPRAPCGARGLSRWQSALPFYPAEALDLSRDEAGRVRHPVLLSLRGSHPHV